MQIVIYVAQSYIYTASICYLHWPVCLYVQRERERERKEGHLSLPSLDIDDFLLMLFNTIGNT